MHIELVTNAATHSALNKAASCRAQIASNPRMAFDKRWNLFNIAYMQLSCARRARLMRLPFPY